MLTIKTIRIEAGKRHVFEWLFDDLPLDSFSTLQFPPLKSKIKKKKEGEKRCEICQRDRIQSWFKRLVGREPACRPIKTDGTSRCDCQFVCVNRLIETLHPIGCAYRAIKSKKEEEGNNNKQMEMMGDQIPLVIIGRSMMITRFEALLLGRLNLGWWWERSPFSTVLPCRSFWNFRRPYRAIYQRLGPESLVVVVIVLEASL